MEYIDNPVVVVDGTPIESYNPEFQNHMITDRNITASGYLSEHYSGREFRKFIYKNLHGEVVKISPWFEYFGEPDKPIVTSPPTVSSVKIVGQAIASGTLFCQYDFQDADGDLEGDSIITWYYTRSKYKPYIAVQNYSSGALVIPGNALFDCYVCASVKPVSLSGEVSEQEYFSNAVGPIPYSYDYPTVKIGFNTDET